MKKRIIFALIFIIACDISSFEELKKKKYFKDIPKEFITKYNNEFCWCFLLENYEV